MTAPAIVGELGAATPPEKLALVRGTQLPAGALTAPEANFRSMMDLAQTLIESGFLPRHIKTPAQCVAVILTGREMGIGPMASLRSVMMVEGKPEVAADLQLGLFKKAGGQAVFQRLDEKGAVLKLRHPNGDEHVETFAEADAQRAGLVNKDNWKRYPKAMYRSRVITAGLKSLGFEAVAGAYDVGELADSPLLPASTALVADTQGRQLAEAVGDDGELIRVDLDTVVPFGKHEGKTVAVAGLAHFRRVVNNAEPEQRTARWFLFAKAAVEKLEEASGTLAPALAGEPAKGVESADKEDDLPF